MLAGDGAPWCVNFVALAPLAGSKGSKDALRGMGRQANSLASPKLSTRPQVPVEDCMPTASLIRNIKGIQSSTSVRHKRL